jgi:predicted DNA-binding transcriptional regulator YafY
MNKSPKPDLQRYFEIDAYLKGGKPRSLAEIHRKLGGDNVISSNMVKNDIQKIITLWSADIIIEERHRKIYYNDPNFSIKNFPITEKELIHLELATHTLQNLFSTKFIKRYNSAMSKILKGFDRTSDTLEENYREELVVTQYIQPEISHSKKGYEWIEKIFDSIYNKTSIEINYQKPNKDAEYKVISPYLLKAFRNRWYLIGFDHTKKEKARIYSLERISDIKDSDEIYYESDTFDSNKFFEYIFGIFQDDDKEPIKLELEFYNTAIQQVIDQPLMPNQKHQLSEDKKVLKAEITVFNSGELIRAILGFGASVKVISPIEIVEIVKKRLETALKNYN